GDEGRALHQRVAGGKLRAGEMVGEDAVLDRAEQRGDDAEQEQRDEQQQHRMQAEADDGDERKADLGKLEPLGHPGLVVPGGKLAAERRQKKVGRDEDRGGERNQRLRVRAADMEQKQKNQRGLEEIVAECREKLGPEQGREAPRHQQGRGHGYSAGSNGRGARMLDKRWFGLLPRPASEAQRGEGWGEGLFASAPLTQLTSWQTPLCPLPASGARARAAPTAYGRR